MSTVFRVIAAVCVIVVIMQHVDAACYKKGPDVKLGNGGIKEYSCLYDGQRYLPGQTWIDRMKCRGCKCSKDGSDCCETYKPLTFGDGDSKCINVIRQCRNVWVVRGHQTMECPECWIPKITNTTGNK